MMSRSKFALIVGYASTIWHLFVTYFLVYFTAGVEEAFEEDKVTSKEAEGVDVKKYNHFKELVHEYISGMLGFGIIVSIAMVIVSILLIVGIKKQRHRLVAPFVYLSFISLFFYIVHIFFDSDVDDEKEDKSDDLEIITCVCYAAIWYPIYKMYKKMRYDYKHPTIAPVNPHYVPYVAPAQACPQPQVLTNFSHSAKYVLSEVKAPVPQHVYPTVSNV